MTLAVTLLHRSIVSNAYLCGWSRSWKNSVVDVELQVRGSVNTLTQVHSALAGYDVRNLWLLDKVTCVQPSSPPELSPSPPFPSPEFQSCLPFYTFKPIFFVSMLLTFSAPPAIPVILPLTLSLSQKEQALRIIC